MVEDFVRENVAYLRCTECGKETKILQMRVSKVFNFPVIDQDATNTNIEVFSTIHGLCKKPETKQYEI